jgi:hypothetical protein
MNEGETQALQAIAGVHATDPRQEQGRPRAVVYAERLTSWVRRLAPEPSAALLIAAAAQHLERWAIPRESYPEGRGGYLRWRAAVHARQGERLRELLAQSGCEAALVARVSALVAKAAPRADADAQILEDAACLVFLETELVPFMAEYPRAKTLDVLRKTWRKMSAAGRKAALALALPDAAASVIREALSSP